MLKKNSNFSLVSGWLLVAFGLMVSAPLHAATTIKRTTGYDYDVTTGRLLKEVTEPTDGKLCSVKAFQEPDIHGRPKKTVVRNCSSANANQTSGAPAEPAALAVGSLELFDDRVTQVSLATDPRWISQTTNALSQTVSFVYDDKLPVPVRQTDENNLDTVWSYDALGRKVKQIQADDTGVSWSYQYCSGFNGGTLSCPTVGGAAAVYAVTSHAVKASGMGASPRKILATTTFTQTGAYTRTYFDALNREIRQEVQGFDGNNVTSKLVYVDTHRDKYGDVVKKSRPYYAGELPAYIETDYDRLHRPTAVRQRVGGNAVATTTYSYNGLVTTITDPVTPGSTSGSSRVITRNLAGLEASVRDAKGGTISHKYDPFANRVETTDPASNVVSTKYNILGYKTQSNDPDLGVWTYKVDALGQLKEQTNANSKLAKLSYDKLGRVIKREDDSLVSDWAYDSCTNGKGKLCESKVSGFVKTYAFDSYGRPSTMTVSVGVTSPKQYVAKTEYDANGRISKLTYPGQAAGAEQIVQNNYSTLGYLVSVQDQRAAGSKLVLWSAKSMDAAGHFTKFSYGNGVETNTTYYEDGRMWTRGAGVLNASLVNDNKVQNFTHTYDNVGNLVTRLDSAVGGVSADYKYDELYRLLAEKRTGGNLSAEQNLAWTYNAIGNIQTRTEGSQVDTYNYNSSGSGSLRPHAVANVGGVVNGRVNPSYEYDANGNMLSGAGRTITWTSFNKPNVMSTDAGVQLTYTYDADHQRATERYQLNGVDQRTTTYISALYEEETGPTGTVKKYFVPTPVGNVAMIVNQGTSWKTQYWHKDHLASNTVVTNEAGAVVERLSYDPFGKRRYSTGETDANGNLTGINTDRGYTEHEHVDELGLINMNARFYDPALGRFISADTLIPNTSGTQDYNRYAYVLNNPFAYSDPTGHAPVIVNDSDLSNASVDAALRFDFVTGHLGVGDAVKMSQRITSNKISYGSVNGNGSLSANISTFDLSVGGTPTSLQSESISLSSYDKFRAQSKIGLGIAGAVPFFGLVPDVVDMVWTYGEYFAGKADKLDLTLATGSVVATVLPGTVDVGFAGAKTARAMSALDAAKGVGKLPGPATDRAGNQIGRIVVDSRGNAMIEPVGGRTVSAGKGGVDTHTLYPNGSNYQRLNPQGHGNNPTPHGHGHAPGTGPGMKGQGSSLDVNGNVVPWNSPAAHWPIY